MAKEAEVSAPEETAEATISEGRAEAEDVFYTAPDGTRFSNQDELTKAWANFVPKSEYTKKTQTLAQERAAFEAQMREFETTKQAVEREKQRIQEYDTLDRYVNSRPDAWKRWMEEAQQGASANDVREQLKADFEKEYGAKLEELDAWRQQQEAQATRSRVYDALKGKYSDFNETAMDSLLDTLSSGDPEAIAEALYWSERGRKSQTEIAEEMERGEREKSEAGIPGKTTLGTPRRPKIPPGATIDDMREIGKRNAGG